MFLKKKCRKYTFIRKTKVKICTLRMAYLQINLHLILKITFVIHSYSSYYILINLLFDTLFVYSVERSLKLKETKRLKIYETGK